jgi:V8-like Glu-specific endopeptidase
MQPRHGSGLVCGLTLAALCLCACTSADSPPPSPASHAEASTAIYFGERSLGADAVVAVYYQRPGTTTLRLCTGTLIAPDVVVTAKHCLYDEVEDDVWEAMPTSALEVVAGDAALDSLGAVDEVVGVAAIATTPGGYTRADALAGDDIAVLTLDAALGVAPADVSFVAPSVGDIVGIAGFGFTEDDVLGVKHEASADVSVVAAGTFETTGDSWTCTGDSGGPAFDVAGALIGVTSIGPTGCPASRSIYTRVDRHRDMLEAALGVDGPGDAGSGDVGGDVRNSDDVSGGDAGTDTGDGGLCRGRRCDDDGGSGATAGGADSDDGGGCSATGSRSVDPAFFCVLALLVGAPRRRSSRIGGVVRGR